MSLAKYITHFKSASFLICLPSPLRFHDNFWLGLMVAGEGGHHTAFNATVIAVIPMVFQLVSADIISPTSSLIHVNLRCCSIVSVCVWVHFFYLVPFLLLILLLFKTKLQIETRLTSFEWRGCGSFKTDVKTSYRQRNWQLTAPNAIYSLRFIQRSFGIHTQPYTLSAWPAAVERTFFNADRIECSEKKV